MRAGQALWVQTLPESTSHPTFSALLSEPGNQGILPHPGRTTKVYTRRTCGQGTRTYLVTTGQG